VGDGWTLVKSKWIAAAVAAAESPPACGCRVNPDEAAAELRRFVWD
jgi:hypothetical protein